MPGKLKTLPKDTDYVEPELTFSGPDSFYSSLPIHRKIWKKMLCCCSIYSLLPKKKNQYKK